MARTTIRNQHQKILGYVEDTQEGQKALHHTLRLLGTYTPRDNYTRDWSGKIVGTGNQLTSLIDRAN